MPKITHSEAMAEVLVQEGVTHVAGIFGSAFMDLLDLFPAAGIEYVSVRHEQTAGHMEDAYGRLTGKAGVVIGQNGPGITNYVTSVATANMAHTPMVVISPSAASVSVGLNGFQECDTWNLFKPITKASLRVPHPNRCADVLRTAFRIAYAERGPVVVDIPRDYFYGEQVEEVLKPHQYRVAPGGIGDPVYYKQALELLKKAQKPVIISGRGAVDADAVDLVRELAEYLNAPVICSYQHIDAFPCDHPLWTGPIGYMGSKAAMYSLQEADVVLAIGTRLSVFGTLPQYEIPYFPKTAEIIQIDINPKHIGMVHPITVGLAADAKAASQEILNGLRAQGAKPQPSAAVHTMIRTRLADWRKEIALIAEEPTRPGTMHPRKALERVCRIITETNAIATTDIGNTASNSNSYLGFKRPKRHIPTLTFGNTGFAFQAALGAQLACPEDPVVTIVGDGAWNMSHFEIPTALQYNLPVVACVFNNGIWGAEMKNQVDYYDNRLIGADVPSESYAKIAKAMGAQSVRINKPEDIDDALYSAIKSRRLTVLEIITDPDHLVPPFRKDALAYPRRHLAKYEHLDYAHFGKK